MAPALHLNTPECLYMYYVHHSVVDVCTCMYTTVGLMYTTVGLMYICVHHVVWLMYVHIHGADS